MTSPVRKCGALEAVLGWSEGLKCLADLGLTPACAETWLYNAQNTREGCELVCLRAWAFGWPANKPDGSLNDCLQCDEDKSGPVFKAVAGRTRRRSGLLSAITRPPSQIAHVVHRYWERCAAAHAEQPGRGGAAAVSEALLGEGGRRVGRAAPV